jgi:hypothetical protein
MGRSNLLADLLRRKLLIAGIIILPLIAVAAHIIPTDTVIQGSVTANSAQVDNINIDGNTISTTDAAGNLVLTPHTTGQVFVGTTFGVGNLDFDTNTISGSADVNITSGASDSVIISPELAVDNLLLNGNTISTTNANGNLLLEPNGVGETFFMKGARMQAAGTFSFADSDSGEAVGIKAPATVPINYTITLPTGQGGSGQGLINDGSGNLSWGAAGGGGGISNAEYNFIIAGDGNSRFEENVTGWTGSTTAPTLETTDEIEGDASLSWDPAGAETLRSDAFTIPKAFYGTNCYAEISYTGGDVDYTLEVLDGTNTEIASSCGVTTDSNAFEVLSGESAIAYCTFVCPTSGSAKISLVVGSNEPEIIIDRAYLGSNFRLSEVNQASLAGESYFAATTNCAGWVVTSTSAAAFATDADCPGPTVVRSQLGSWQTTDANLPIQTINDLPAGTYKATFLILSGSSAASGSRYHINDGTTTSIGSPGYNDLNSAAVTVSATFQYASAGNRSFQLYGSAVSGSVTVFGSVSPTNFILERFPSASQIAYTPPSQREITNVFSALVTDGAVTTTVSNENQDWIDGNCTNASAGRYVCTFISGVFSVAPNCTIVAAHSDNNDTSVVYDSISSTQIAFSTIRAGAYSDRNSMIMCQRGAADYSAKESTAPLLVNSVVSGYAGVLNQQTASIDCDGASSINSQLGSWVSSVGNISAGQCSITLLAGAFASTPYCFATELLSGSAPRALSMTNTSATALTIDCVGNTGSDCSDFDANIMCIGPK